MSAVVRFDAAALQDLEERTEYEAWLLEAVYRIADRAIPFGDLDQLVYPPGGGPPAQVIHGAGGINLRDWRPGFLKAGAPLVLVTDFKLLDMLLEWILVQNGSKGTWVLDEFKEKLLRRSLDELAAFHECPLLGQLEPGFVTVRVYAREGDPLRLDLDRIRADIAVKRSNRDAMFQVRVVSVAAAGSNATAYLLPWNSLKNRTGVMELQPNELAPHLGTLPDDLDLAAIGAALEGNATSAQ
jgi:hypothetical protein